MSYVRITGESARPMHNTRETAIPLEGWQIVEGCLLAHAGRYVGIIAERDGHLVRTPFAWYALLGRPRQ